MSSRTTVIVSRNQHYQVAGAIVVHSLEAALAACAGDDEPFLIGGAELYRASLQLASNLYVTEIKEEFEGDAFLLL